MSTNRAFQLPTKKTCLSSAASKHDVSDENGNTKVMSSEYNIYRSLRSTLSKDGSNNCKVMNTPRNPCSLKKREYTSKHGPTSSDITDTDSELAITHDGSVDGNGHRTSPGKNSDATLKRPHGGHHRDNRKRLKSESAMNDDNVDVSSDSSRSLQADNGKKNIFEFMPESNIVSDCPKRLIGDMNDNDETLRSPSCPKKITNKADDHATSLSYLLSKMPTLTIQITRLESMFSMNVKSSGPKIPLPAHSHSPSSGNTKVSMKDQNSSETTTKDGVNLLMSVSPEAPSVAVATLISLPPNESKVTTSPSSYELTGLSGVPPPIVTETIQKFVQFRECKSNITGFMSPTVTKLTPDNISETSLTEPKVASPRCHRSPGLKSLSSTPFNSRKTTPKSTMLKDINITISQKTPAVTKTTKSAIPKLGNGDLVEFMSGFPKEHNISEIAIKPLLLTVDKSSVGDIDTSSSSSVSANQGLIPSMESNRPETTPKSTCLRDVNRNTGELNPLLLKEANISETFQSFEGDNINVTELTLSPGRNSKVTCSFSTPKDDNNTVTKDVSIHLTTLLPQKKRKLCNLSPCSKPVSRHSPLKDYDRHLTELRTLPETNREMTSPGKREAELRTLPETNREMTSPGKRETEFKTSPCGYIGVAELNPPLPGGKVTENQTSSPTGNNVRRRCSPGNGKVTRSNSSSPVKGNDTRSMTSSLDEINVTKSTLLSPIESKITRLKSSLPKADISALSDPMSPAAENHMVRTHRSPAPDDSNITGSASSSPSASPSAITVTTQESSSSKDDDFLEAEPNTPASVACDNKRLQSLSPVNRITKNVKTTRQEISSNVKPKNTTHDNPNISKFTNSSRKEMKPKSSTSVNSQITGLRRYDANHKIVRLKSPRNKLTCNGRCPKPISKSLDIYSLVTELGSLRTHTVKRLEPEPQMDVNSPVINPTSMSHGTCKEQRKDSSETNLGSLSTGKQEETSTESLSLLIIPNGKNKNNKVKTTTAKGGKNKINKLKTTTTKGGKNKINKLKTTITKGGKNKNKLKTTTAKGGKNKNNKLKTTITKGGKNKINKHKITATKIGKNKNKLKTTTAKGGKNKIKLKTTTKGGKIKNNKLPSFFPELGNIKIPKENGTSIASNQTIKTYRFFASKNQIEDSNSVGTAVSASHSSLDTKSGDVTTNSVFDIYDMDVNMIPMTLPITDNKQDFPVRNIKPEPDVKVLGPKPVCSKKVKAKRLKSTGTRCPVCVRFFPFLSQLKVHLLTHTGQRPHQCDFCLKTFIRVSDLRTHLRIHTKDKPYVCDVCSRAFAQSSHLFQHEKVHSGEKPYKCDACGKAFKIKSHLNAHITCSHNSEKAHTCEKCGKSYKLKSHLVHHSRSHLPFSLHTCSVCEKSFKTMSSLKRHQKCHSDIKPFECQDCGQTFREKHNMLRHQKISQGDFDMPFSCKYCSKLFRQKDHLVVHLRVHTDERPYECEACGKLFKQIGALRIHHKLHIRWEDL